MAVAVQGCSYRRLGYKIVLIRFVKGLNRKNEIYIYIYSKNFKRIHESSFLLQNQAHQKSRQRSRSRTVQRTTKALTVRATTTRQNFTLMRVSNDRLFHRAGRLAYSPLNASVVSSPLVSTTSRPISICPWRKNCNR